MTNKKVHHIFTPTKDPLVDAMSPLSDKELEVNPTMQKKIDKLIKFFEESGIDYSKFNPEAIPRLDLDKKRAYPNNDEYMNIPPARDTNKWLNVVKEIYYKEKNGSGRIPAIRQLTAGWSLPETFDFLNWLRFYESGSHMKYKTAQLWYQNDSPGYFLHVKKDQDKNELSEANGKDIDAARDGAESSMSLSEKKNIIEKQRNKIIGRLDSAEKLLRSDLGQIFGGKEFEVLLQAIYDLKRKIQTVNKVSVSTRLYDDMIIRESNILGSKGFTKAAETLYSVAQANNPPPSNTGTLGPIKKVPAVVSPDSPMKPSGAPGGLPSMGPGMAQTPPESAPNDMSPAEPQGISGFLTNLETGNVSTVDKQKSNDNLDIEEMLSVEDDDLMVTEAQALPPPALTPPPVKTPKPKSDVPLEVSESDLEKQVGKNPEAPKAKDFDNMIDAAFSNLTIEDVVSKLEDLAKIFKTREIPRQLAIVDMMLDSLGLASYFPTLSEATNKSLESNN